MFNFPADYHRIEQVAKVFTEIDGTIIVISIFPKVLGWLYNSLASFSSLILWMSEENEFRISIP